MDNAFKISLVMVLVLALGFLLSEDVSAQKIIIINESDSDHYSIDDMLLSGDFATNQLRLTGSGNVIRGDSVKVYLLGLAEDILISDVTVNGQQAPVSFDEKGYYMVLGEGKFSFDSRMHVRTPGQAKLYVPGPVNLLRFELTNGYAVNGDQYGLYDRTVIIQRSAKVAMLSEGSFKYSFADRNSFYYRISYKSFGKSLGKSVLNLANGERVLTVTGARDYSVSGNRLTLELEGQTADVYVSGTFSSNTIRIPLPEGKHHVLLESDPEKKISISTGAEEIDLSQSTSSPTYSNARAFMAGQGDVFTVTVTKLEKFPSLAASVRQSTNTIAVNEKGSMLAELRYQYSNTGVDYIKLDAPGTPLYAATGYNTPVKLTKEGDSLYLSFPKTNSGTLDVIYYDATEPLGLVSMIDVPSANTDLPISAATTRLILPKDYYVVDTFGVKGGSELPSIESSMVFLLVFGSIGYFLGASLVFAAAYIVFSIGLYMFSPTIFALSLVVALLLILKRHVSQSSVKWLAAGTAVVVVVCLLIVSFFSIVGMFSMGSSSNAVVQYQADKAMVEEVEAAPMMAKSRAVLGSGSAKMTVPVKEGVLPVKLEIPQFGKSVTVTSYLVTEDDPLKMSVLVVSTWLKVPLYLISLLSGLLLAKTYRSEEKKKG